MLDRFHALKEHFPQCFDKNGDLMPQKLQEAILDLAQEINAQTNTATQDLENEATFSLSKESYSLNWLGKSYAKLLRHLPTHTLIAQDSAHNAQPQNANSKNVLIKGDNLEVLKHLKNAYYRKVKMIYIDPPYNTGNGDFIYNDERSFTPQSLAQMANIELEEASSILNLTLKNSSTHSAWLSFMYPRLYIARQLLRDDGVIFISIDDNEQANLKLLCDEIFGEENFVACMPRITKKAGKSTDKVANNHDYVLCYFKNDIILKQIEVKAEDYKEKDEFFEERGGYKLNQTLDYDSLSYSKNGDYEIILNDKKYYAGGSYEKFIERQNGNFNRLDWVWRWRKDKLDFGLKNGFIEVRNNRIYTKTYFKCKITDKKPYKIEYINRTKNVSSIELLENKYSNDSANKNLQEIFGQKNIFDYSKSSELIKFLVSQISTTPNSNDIILDFFAGSGTTAQAVMELNAEDKGNREFILVQLDEAIDKSKSKTAYEFCKNELGSENPSIFDITKERIKRASAKIAQNSNLDLGFKIYELRENDFDSQNGALFKEVDKNALLESFRLQDSTPLSVENQTIDLGGYKAIRAGEKLYLLNSGFEMKHLQKLISLIDAQKDFVIKEISYLNDTFESARIREIEEGIKSYSNKKELKILVRGRFI